MTGRRAWVAGVGGLAAVAVVIGLLLSTRGGGDAEGWRAPVALPAPLSARATAVAADGSVLAVWSEERRGRTAVRASTFGPDGTWSAPTTIQAPQTWEASVPTVAVGPRGDVVAVWSWHARSRSVLMASRRPAGGAWEAPQALGRSVYGTYNPAVAADGRGGVAVAFRHDPGPGAEAAATVRPPGAPWTDPVPLPPDADAGSPRVSIAPDGRTLVATTAASDVGLSVRGPGDAGWRSVPPPATGTAGAGYADAAVAIDPQGRAVLAWTHPARGGVTTLWTATLRPAGWTRPAPLDRVPSAQGFTRLTATLTSRGVVVAWSRWSTRWTRVAVRATTAGGPARTVAEFAIRDARGGPGEPTPGPPPGWVLAASGGDPVVMWDRLVTRGPVRESVLEVSRMDSAGRWAAPERVAHTPVAGYPLAVGHRRDGLVAAWAQFPAPGAPGTRVLAAERIG